MITGRVVKRIRLGDDVNTYCGKCKEERTHQIVALNAGEIERVVCHTCGGNHLYREKQKTTAGARTLAPRRKAAEAAPLNAARARSYSPREKFATGDVISHPKFGLGEVMDVRSEKIDVRFAAERRTLIHAG